jgi:hypothetical protein
MRGRRVIGFNLRRVERREKFASSAAGGIRVQFCPQIEAGVFDQWDWARSPSRAGESVGPRPLGERGGHSGC